MPLEDQGLPTPGAFGAPAGRVSGSLDSIPSRAPQLPSEKIGSALLDVAAARLSETFNRHKTTLDSWGEQTAAGVLKVKSEIDGYTNLSRQARQETAAEREKKIREALSKNLSAELQSRREDINRAAAEIEAQGTFWRSPEGALTSQYGLSDRALNLSRHLEHSGLAELLGHYTTSHATGDRELGAALVHRLGTLTEAERRAFDEKGFTRRALATRLIGEEFRVARLAIARATVHRLKYAAAERRLTTGVTMPDSKTAYAMAFAEAEVTRWESAR